MFLICTLSNKPEQYAEMKASLMQAGFTQDKCRYQVFDNSTENRYDPYRTISRVLAEAAEPYVLFCHQDILLDKGQGFEQLVSQLNHLSQLDPQWAVAGNAGSGEDLALVSRITDPNGDHLYGTLPQPVCSLDENFLVLRTAARLHCSDALSGFHLYGTDLCLQALQRGFSAYVIDFHLTHLSSGNTEGTDFKKSLAQFQKHWDSAFLLRIMNTPCTTSTSFALSRSRVIRCLLMPNRIRRWVRRHMGLYLRISRTKKKMRQTCRLSP